MSPEFLITSLIVVLLPGTGVIYTLSIGLSRGFRQSILAAFGCTLGILPAAIASIVGLAAILHTSALAYQAIKFLGVAYLLFMAWSIFRDESSLSVDGDSPKKSPLKVIINGTLLNVLNPKLSLFFLAFLPQFIPAGTENGLALMSSLAAIFMLMTFVVFIAYGALASLARDYVTSRPTVLKWFRRSFAACFGLLGLKLALSEK
ncbi:MAG: LysE family translocator [Rhodobacteraceae bacterium]|nr:LysE family translocator [Paracoccaceae bacterium]